MEIYPLEIYEIRYWSFFLSITLQVSYVCFVKQAPVHKLITVEPFGGAMAFAPDEWPLKRGGLLTGVKITISFSELYSTCIFPRNNSASQTNTWVL